MFEASSATGSFAWKSILRSKNLIERNARWQIGNGNSIRVFKDAWLPNSNDGRILFHRGVLAPDATVDTLIDPHSGWWNVNLIDQCFFPPDAKTIKSLPLCFIPQSDSLVWPAERSGKFSVKSGYKCLCEDLLVREHDLETVGAAKGFWKSVWSLNVPRKIKHFLWKSCTNSLPTNENLLKKTIVSENVCHLCSEHPEDGLHALWGCLKFRQVWQSSFGWLVNHRVLAVSFSDLVRSVQSSPNWFPLFAVTAWVVWHHRNKSRLQAATIPLNQVAGFAKSFLQSFVASHRQERPLVCGSAGPVKWKPPSASSVKINFDGALFGESDRAGLGVVIRNSNGKVSAALSEKIMKPQSAELVEILATRRAVLFSCDLGFQNSVFEGNSTSVVKLLQDRCVSDSLGVIF